MPRSTAHRSPKGRFDFYVLGIRKRVLITWALAGQVHQPPPTVLPLRGRMHLGPTCLPLQGWPDLTKCGPNCAKSQPGGGGTGQQTQERRQLPPAWPCRYSLPRCVGARPFNPSSIPPSATPLGQCLGCEGLAKCSNQGGWRPLDFWTGKPSRPLMPHTMGVHLPQSQLDSTEFGPLHPHFALGAQGLETKP